MSVETKHWTLWLSLLFLGIGFTLGWIHRPLQNADRFAPRVEKDFQKMEEKLESYLASSDLLVNLSENRIVAGSYQELDIYEQPFTVTVYHEDSLLFWNNTFIGSDILSSGLFDKYSDSQLLYLPNGSFYMRIDSLEDKKKIATFFPIKHHYKINSIYLKDVFSADENGEGGWHSSIPAVKIDVMKPGAASTPIVGISGKELFSLNANMPVKMPWVSYALFFLYVLSVIFGLVWLTAISRKISRNKKPWMGIATLAGAIILFRLLMVYFDAVVHFEDVPMFSNRYHTNYFADTVGDMLINTLLSLWIAVFFFKEFKIESPGKMTENKRLLTAIGLYSVILCGILGITYILRGLVLGTDIPFDFDNIGDLTMGSIISIVGVLFLMLMLFLFTFRISLVIRELQLSIPRRLMTLGIAVLLSFSIIYLNLILDPVTMTLLLLFSIIYTVSFDLYVEKDPSNLLWVVVWLVIYSAFSSSFLYKYNQLKEWSQRRQYAEFLTEGRDKVMEQDLRRVEKEVGADGEISINVSERAGLEVVDKLLKRNHNVDLRFVKYGHKLHLFSKDSLGEITSVGEESDIGLLKIKDEDFRVSSSLTFKNEADALGSYLLQFSYPKKDSKVEEIMILEFSKEMDKQSRISTELFLNKEYMEMEGLSKYEYALYRNNKRVFEENASFPEILTGDIVFPNQGVYEFSKVDGKSRMVYHAMNGNIAIMDIQLPNFIYKVRSLNSYLFTIMVIVLFVFMIINTLPNFLTLDIDAIFAPLPTLRNKIQVSVIAIIVLSFLVIGVSTIIFFEQKNDEYHEDRLGRKAKSVRGDTAREIKQEDVNAGNLDKFKDIVPAISSIHRMDINIYDLNGKLIESSGDDVFSKGLKSPLMNPAAFYELGVLNRDKVTMDRQGNEKIGSLSYDTQYEQLKDKNGNLIAFIGMPYYSQNSVIQDDTSDFIGTLLNVYFVLLFLAGVIAIFVANSITKPLSQIGEKLKGVKIGKKNEAIEWTTKDELGALIGEYNKMIKKLDDSTQLLAQSERESAWREMAKQVAHEIKNPLTPMKLSIQYLQHAYHANPDNMESMLQRVCNTLIEQIDNLSHIATEFSNFAKMPRAENELFEVNLLVQSVFDLFSEQRDMDMSISLPSKQLKVFADKKQLMQVFNNLIKNAMQAIPEEKRGEIDVILREIEGSKVQLEVKDNGSGIPKDMEEYIFVPHITTKSSGTGLGLAISRSIVEAADGDIYFETEEDIGTSFYVELPISKEEKY